MSKIKLLNVFYYLVVGLLIATLGLITTARLNSIKPQGDGIDNFTYAFNLSRHFTITDGSLDGSQNFLYSNQREPFPIFLSAAWIKLNPSTSQIASKEELLKGENLIQLKLQNVFYVLLILLGVLSLSHILLGKNCSLLFKAGFSICSILLVYYCLPIKNINNLLTEFQAGFLLLWFIVSWLHAWKVSNFKSFLLAGLLLGLLYLTKASFLYIAIVSFIFFTIYLFFLKENKKLIYQNFIILIVSILVILPWYARNYVSIGVWELVQRGPVVLIVRAYKSRMTDEEFKGAFYAYAPSSLKRVMSSLTGFNENDRLTGGRLQRLTRYPIGDLEKREQLNEKDAISYYIQATTHYRIIYQNFLSSTNDKERARILTDQVIKKESLKIISDNLELHIRSSFAFAWRGLWPHNSTDGRLYKQLKKPSLWKDLIPFFGFIVMFGIFIHGLIKKNVPHVIFSIIGVSTFLFFAFLTHFVPRYSIVTLPIWVVSGLYGPSLIIINWFKKSKLSSLN